MISVTPARYWFTLFCGAAALGAVLLLAPGIGSQTSVGPIEAWRAWQSPDANPLAHQIAFSLRLPRTLLAVQVGITLALCGAVFQTLFRNPLATPYTLGISSGGSLGALLAIKLGFEVSILGISSISLAAFLGAMAVVGVVFLVTRGARRFTTNELLLSGVTLGLFCSAMMMLVTYFSNARQTFEIVRWMMGSLDTVGHFENTTSLPLTVPAWIVLIAAARSLNQYLLGDELARTRGVNIDRLRFFCIFFASLATAAVVAICGPIGFVGLVVPQIIALITGRDCRILFPMSALAGGVFLAICDWISQLAMTWVGWASHRDLAGVILPVGVVTAVVGVPIFLVLLHRRMV